MKTETETDLTIARRYLRTLRFELLETRFGFEVYQKRNRQEFYETDCLADAIAAAEWIHKTKAKRCEK